MAQYPEYLKHYGIIGMKWGVRRFQPYPKDYHGDGKFTPEESAKKQRHDAREVRSEERPYLRRLSAAERNVRRTAKDLREPEKEYAKAHKQYLKTQQKMYFRKSTAEAERSKAEAKLKAAANARKAPLYEFVVSKEVYDRFANDYKNFIKDAKKRYPNLTVEAIESKDIDLGGDLVKEMFRTGVTVANTPVIGGIYTGVVTRKPDREVRRAITERKLSGNL